MSNRKSHTYLSQEKESKKQRHVHYTDENCNLIFQNKQKEIKKRIETVLLNTLKLSD